MSETLVSALREQTAEVHQRVESLAEQLGALSSLPAFITHLTVLMRHHRALALNMDAAPALRALVEERIREMEADLALLGAPAFVSRNLQSETLSAAGCFGAAYVIEGSRLGAMVIAKRLRQAGIEVEGLRSVGGDADLVRARWLTFVGQLAQLPPEVWSDVCDAASATFETLAQRYAEVLALGRVDPSVL